MAKITSDRVAQRLVELDLVDGFALQDVWRETGRDCSGEELVQALQRRNLMTNWQVDRVLKDYSVGYFFGDYKILYLAGAGSFARVYRAAHRETGEIVAVKVLRNRHLDDENVVKHFLREGQVGLKLKHPNIVGILHVGTEGHTHYIVMEFVEGNNLKEFVKIRKRLEPAEATRIVSELAGAIKYANQQGLSHRDLKMTNVLMSTQGHPKLIDFGLAARQGDDSVPRTVDYAGLEKAGGADKNDPRSDLYFLGCIYYHMLSGEPPLGESKNRAERGARGRFLSMIPIQHRSLSLPQYIGEIVDRLTHINPEIRYQTPAQLLIDLKRANDRLAGKEVEEASVAASAVSEGPKRPVMIVEADLELQEAFREGLRKTGYRVLMTTDPMRALERFKENPRVAECVVFDAESTGEAALEAFNEFGQNPETAATPAVLLLGPAQREWRGRAVLDEHRVFMTMPIKLKALRAVLGRLLVGPQPV